MRKAMRFVKINMISLILSAGATFLYLIVTAPTP